MLVTVDSPNSSVLRAQTIPVVGGDEAIQIILALEAELERLGTGIGLAAPQIGISKSVAIIRHAGVSLNLINPSIIGGGNELKSEMEGCLSFPGRRWDVQRYGTVRIKNHLLWPSAVGSVALNDDVNRKPIDRLNPPKGMNLVPAEQVYVVENPVEDCGGVICVAVQHELDHLFGVTLDTKQGAKEHYELATGDNKVGRNDPCPCNSGTKYKKFCLLKEYERGIQEIYEKEVKEEQEWQKWFKDDEEQGRKNIAAAYDKFLKIP
jgi:peptide deformylase